MPDIPIHNETDYDLTPLMLDSIRSDAMAYFGDSIHAIRVQSGLDRPTFNVKTGEVRYAFFLSDYESSGSPSPATEADGRRPRAPSLDEGRAALVLSDFVEGADPDDDAFAILDEASDVLDDDEGAELKRMETDVDAIEDADPNLL